MAYGGGRFIDFDKDIIGIYERLFDRTTAITETIGVVALRLSSLNGGPSGVFGLTNVDFQDGQYIFGETITSAKYAPLREVFKKARYALIYNGATGGVKAANDYATALNEGTNGNNLTVVITANEDLFDVKVVQTLNGVSEDVVVIRAISTLAGLPENAFVSWKEDAVLEATAGTPLTGGTDRTDTSTIDQWLNSIEQYNFDVIVDNTSTATEVQALCKWVQDMRDDLGRKILGVFYNANSNLASIYSVVQNPSLVWWIAGAIASCGIYQTLAGMEYDGEFRNLITNYSTRDIRNANRNGQVIIHDIERGQTPEAVVFGVYDERTNLINPTIDYEPSRFRDGYYFRVRDIINERIKTYWKALMNKVPAPLARNVISQNTVSILDGLQGTVIGTYDKSQVTAVEPVSPPGSSAEVVALNRQSTDLTYPLVVLGFAKSLYITVDLY